MISILNKTILFTKTGGHGDREKHASGHDRTPNRSRELQEGQLGALQKKSAHYI